MYQCWEWNVQKFPSSPVLGQAKEWPKSQVRTNLECSGKNVNAGKQGGSGLEIFHHPRVACSVGHSNKIVRKIQATMRILADERVAEIRK